MTTISSAPWRTSIPAAGRYRLNPSRTVVAFRTQHLFGLGVVSGTMAVTGGEITIDPAAPQASVTATIRAASFRTGNRSRDRDVRARFLHTGQYPDITFHARTLSRAEDGWVLAGELEVRGVSRPVSLLIESVQAAGAGFRAQATTRIDRYAFGITAAKGMAARYLDISLTAVAEPL
jgi:polyisoprenoid-binding protein YceI